MSSVNRPGVASTGLESTLRASRGVLCSQVVLRVAAVGVVVVGSWGCEKKSDETITIALERGTARVRGGQAADAVATLTPVTSRDAAPGATLVAKFTLGHAKSALGREKALELDAVYLDVARLLSEITQIGQSVSVGNTLVAGYRQQDPTAARERIRERIAEAQGGPGKDVWVDTGANPILTLSAARQRLSAAQEQVAAKQAQLRALQDKRRAAIAEADELLRRVDGLSGREAVDAYATASTARKQISLVSGEIDVAEGELAILQAQQGIAEGQVAIVERFIAQLQAQDRAIATGFEQVTSQIASQQAVSRTAVEATGENVASLNARAGELATVMARAEALHAEAEGLFREAAAAYEAAFIEAGRLRAELATRIGPTGDQSRFDAVMLDGLRRSVWPSVFRQQQGFAMAAIAELHARRSAAFGSKARLVNALTPTLQTAGLPMPTSLQGNAAADAKAAMDAATEAYSRAVQELEGAAEGLQGTDAETNRRRQASYMSRMFVFFNWSKMLAIAGDAAGAQQRMQQAIALRDQLVADGVVLPSLPGELAMMGGSTPPPTESPADGQ